MPKASFSNAWACGTSGIFALLSTSDEFKVVAESCSGLEGRAEVSSAANHADASRGLDGLIKSFYTNASDGVSILLFTSLEVAFVFCV